MQSRGGWEKRGKAGETTAGFYLSLLTALALLPVCPSSPGGQPVTGACAYNERGKNLVGEKLEELEFHLVKLTGPKFFQMLTVARRKSETG
jgi:hypothetical protein